MLLAGHRRQPVRERRLLLEPSRLYVVPLALNVVSIHSDPHLLMAFCNHPSAYNSLTPPEHEKVVADCDSALKLDPSYIKALKRRAAALEALDRDEDAIRDYTAVTLLDAFEPPKKVAPGKENEAGEQLERVIKKAADKEAKETLRVRSSPSSIVSLTLSQRLADGVLAPYVCV